MWFTPCSEDTSFLMQFEYQWSIINTNTGNILDDTNRFPGLKKKNPQNSFYSV